MKGLHLLLESASSLPFLGLYSEPQAYWYFILLTNIVKYNNQRHVSPISKVGRNAFWMFQTELSLLENDKEKPLEFYIYNSNSNAEDQLLGWVHITPSTLNFITSTQTKFQLLNSSGHRIQSFISVSSKVLPHIETDHFTDKQSIKIEIMNYVQIEKEDFSTVNLDEVIVKFLYGDSMTGLKYGERNHVIIPYNNFDELSIQLQGIESSKSSQNLVQSFNVKNLKQKKPQFFKLRFFDAIFPHINYVACLVFTIIPNSNLPSNYSWFQLTLKSDLKQNFIVRSNSPLQTTIIKALGVPKMLKLPNSQSSISFEYFDCQKIQEKQLFKESDQETIIKTLAKYKPHQSITIKANELEWTTTQRSEFIWRIKKEKINKNLFVEFQAFKQSKTIVKQIHHVNFVASSVNQNTIKLSQIKLSSCYFYEVLPAESEIHFYHIDFYGKVYGFGSLTIKPNQSQYIVDSRMTLSNDGGQLVFFCYELKLKDNNSEQKKSQKQASEKKNLISMTNQQFIQNHMIFKTKIQKGKEIMSGKVIYNRYFLSFAKKVSLTKLCKKFQQAVHNEALSVKPKFNLWMPFRQGLLEIVNCQFIGFQSFNCLEFTAGSDSKILQGFGSQFLCQKTSFFFVSDKKIKLKMTIGKIVLNVHYCFGQIFGNPENFMNEVKTYVREIDLKGGKLKLWFKFTPLDDRSLDEKMNLLGDQNLQRYSSKIPVKLGIRRLKLLKREGKDILGINKQNQLCLKVRMSHKSSHYESGVEKSAVGCFYFDPKRDYLQTRVSFSEQGKYVFVNVQVSKAIQQKDDKKVQEGQKEQVQQFYNAAIDISKILGQGVIEVKFYDNKSNKLQIIAEVVVLTQNLEKRVSPDFGPDNPRLFLKAESLGIKNKLSQLANFTGYDKSLFKNIYSYFAVVFINGFYYSLVALDSNSKFCQKSLLPVKETLNNQKVLMDSKCVVDIKIVSILKKTQPKQLNEKLIQLTSKLTQFSASNLQKQIQKLEIQIIGEKTFTMSELKLNVKDKQTSFIQVSLNFLGNRQLYSKYSIEQLCVMRKAIQFSLNFQVQKCQSLPEQILQVNSKPNYQDISILKQCLGLIRIKSIIPNNLQRLREEISGDLTVLVNSSTLQYRPENNFFQTDTAVLVEKSELQFILLTKNNPHPLVKKVQLPSYLKTNQSWSHVIDIGQFSLPFQVQCFSNGLTSFNQGALTLRDVSFMNTKADKFKLHYPNQQNLEETNYLSLEKNVTNNSAVLNHKMEIERKMKNLLKGALVFEIYSENQNKKIHAKIYLSQLSISAKFSLDNSKIHKVEFSNQIQVFNDKKPLVICLSGQYSLQKNSSMKQSKKSYRYTILGEKQKQIQVSQTLLGIQNKTIAIGSSQNILPSRKNGVKLELQIPQKFLTHLHQINFQSAVQEITVFGANKGEIFTLYKSKEKFNVFYKYLDKLIEVKNLTFKEPNKETKNSLTRFQIQLLNINQVKNSIKPVYKFMINQNPEFVLTLTQSSYQIPKIIRTQKANELTQQQESLIININIQKLLSESIFQRLNSKSQMSELSSTQKRLLSLKNSPKDEILTTKFCIYLKHGKQQQMIYGVDLEGNMTNNNNNLIKFGYDAEDDQIDVFLCVQQFWNKTLYEENRQSSSQFFVQKYSYDQIEKQWISIMPLNHYLIKISDIKKNNLLFASVMKPFQYNLSQSCLAKELYQRFETKNVAIFGSLSFQEGYWGNLTIKISKLGPLNFRPQLFPNNSGTPKVLCYMRISIEYKKSTIKQINTEAEQWVPGGFLSFKTFLNHLFLQSKAQSDKQYLKFQLFIISEHSSTQKVFEKRYPLEDILSREMRNQKINIKISQSDTNQQAEQFQMEVLFTNTKQLNQPNVFSSSIDSFSQKQLNEVSSENVRQVDMISYKDKSFIDIFKMMLSTHDKTHFQGYIKQVKESFIYEDITFDDQSSPYAILVILLPYLMTNARFCFIDVLEMLQMGIVKNIGVIKHLDRIQQSQGLPYLYQILQSIIEKDNKEEFLKHETSDGFQSKLNELIVSFKDIKGKEKKVPLEKYFNKNNVQKLIECINLHANLFNTKSISENFINEEVSILMLSIISQILEYSDNFLSKITQNIDKWIEFCSFKSAPILMKMIQIIDKLVLLKKEPLNENTIDNLMRVFLSRKVQIDIVYQYWAKLKDDSKIDIFDQIVQKYYLFGEEEQNQTQEILTNKTKMLKLFYTTLYKSSKKSAKSQAASRIKDQPNDKQSQKTGKWKQRRQILTVNQHLIDKFKLLFEKTIFESEHVLLLNSICELFFAWKEIQALNEELIHFILSLAKKYLEKDKKKTQKSATLSKFNRAYFQQQANMDKEEIQKKLLAERNKKSVLENFVKQLSGKEKAHIKMKPKEQGEKKSQGFSKYSKYLITQ